MQHDLRLRAVARGGPEICAPAIEPSLIAAALESAPIVTRLALTSANKRVRARAANRLGEHVANKLAQPDVAFDPRQMAFALADI